MPARRRKTVLKTQEELAKYLRKGKSTVAGWLARGCPGKRGQYVVEDVETWLEATSPEEDAGVDSKALEELRGWKAKREKLAYERDCGLWIRCEEVHAALTTFASVLRQACETLQKQFGREARDIMADAVTDAVAATARTIADVEADGSGDPVGRPADSPAETPDDT